MQKLRIYKISKIYMLYSRAVLEVSSLIYFQTCRKLSKIKATSYLKLLPSGWTLLIFSTAKLERTNKIRSQKHNLNTKMKFWVSSKKSELISMEIYDFFSSFRWKFWIFLNIEIECVPIKNLTVLRLKILFKWKKSLKSA